MGIINYNNVSSEDVNVIVQHFPNMAIPKRGYTFTHVPGRNGDIIQDDGSFENVNREYEIALYNPYLSGDKLEEEVSNVAAWLHSSSGYARLRDSYEPSYFRYAAYEDDVSLTNVLMQAAEATISFNCKPQKYLIKGDAFYSIDAITSYANPTSFDALPIIKLSGGTSPCRITIIGKEVYIIDINTVTDGMLIDSELQDVYKINQNGEYQNLNNDAVIADFEFPKLSGGVAPKITIEKIGSGSDQLPTMTIKPRWWTL